MTDETDPWEGAWTSDEGRVWIRVEPAGAVGVKQIGSGRIELTVHNAHWGELTVELGAESASQLARLAKGMLPPDS